jgi:hypothetical protein
MIMKQISPLSYGMPALAAQLGFKSFCYSCEVLIVLLVLISINTNSSTMA